MATWSKESVLDFIDIYRKHECLWKANSKDYSNRSKRDKGYRELIRCVRTFEPEADKELVVKKIGNLRNSFRKQRRKLHLPTTCKTKPGFTDADDTTTTTSKEPTLWYYNALEFLLDQERPGQPNHEQTDHQQGDDQEVGVPCADEKAEMSDFLVSTDEDESPSSASASTHGASPADGVGQINGNSTNTAMTSHVSAPVGKTSSSRRIGNRTANRLTGKRKAAGMRFVPPRGAVSHHQAEVLHAEPGRRSVGGLQGHHDRGAEDEFDSFGRTVAHKLRAVSREQNIHAQKLIWDVIYEAELGGLSRSSGVFSRETHVIHVSQVKSDGVEQEPIT